MRTKIKITNQQLAAMYREVYQAKGLLISDALTRLNVYKLFSINDLEKRLGRKLIDGKYYSNINLTLVEALTLRDVLSKKSTDIMLSEIYIKLDKFLPKIS